MTAVTTQEKTQHVTPHLWYQYKLAHDEQIIIASRIPCLFCRLFQWMEFSLLFWSVVISIPRNSPRVHLRLPVLNGPAPPISFFKKWKNNNNTLHSCRPVRCIYFSPSLSPNLLCFNNFKNTKTTGSFFSNLTLRVINFLHLLFIYLLVMFLVRLVAPLSRDGAPDGRLL